MNNRQRAEFLVLVDFDYDAPIGIFTEKMHYTKGSKLNLRVSGKMALTLLARKVIQQISEVN